MYNESNWQFLFDVDSETLIRNGKVTESEGGIIKVYWALNGMKQDDPVLIEFIKENVLVEPDNLPLKLANLKVNGLTKMGGQYGQPFEVEKILGTSMYYRVSQTISINVQTGKLMLATSFSG